MTRLEHIRSLFKSIQEKAKAFFHGEKWGEVLVFSFFVLLSFGFWLLQSLQQEYEITISFPIKYKNIPVDVALEANTPNVITAKVRDKGSVLLNYTLGHAFSSIEIDYLKNSKESKGAINIKHNTLETYVQKQLLATTTLQGFEPQEIIATLSQRDEREIPVTFNGDIQLPAGFLVSGPITLTPPKVKAYATTTLLDSLTEIQTTFTTIKNANTTLTRTLSLTKIEGVNFDTETVTVTIPIEEYTEKTLEIPVLCSHIPAHYTIRMFPSTVKVTCGVPLSRFKELSEEMFEIRIPYENLEQNMSGKLPVMLTKQPEWVSTVTLSPQNVEFILENNSHPTTNDHD